MNATLQVVRRLRFSRHKARRCIRSPILRRRRRLLKGIQTASDEAARAHPGKRIAVWLQDEARTGQSGRVCHRWWLNERLCDRRLE